MRGREGETVAHSYNQSENVAVKTTWTFGKAARIGGLPMLWVMTAILMVRNYVTDRLTDPFDPSREGTYYYGHYVLSPTPALALGGELRADRLAAVPLSVYLTFTAGLFDDHLPPEIRRIPNG